MRISDWSSDVCSSDLGASSSQGYVSMSTRATSDGTFEQDVLKAAGPVLVDFWAEWCGPCKMIAPALEEIAAEMDGRVTIAKINIADNPQTPQKYGVRGIPTHMMLRSDERRVGKEWVR